VRDAVGLRGAAIAMTVHVLYANGPPIRSDGGRGRGHNLLEARRDIDALRRWRLMLDLLNGVEQTAETRELGVMARARLLRMGARMGLSNADRNDLYSEGRALADRSDDKELLAALMWSYGASYYMSGQLRDAQPHIAASVRLADEIGHAGFSSAFRVGSGVVALVMGPLAAAFEEMQASIDVADGDFSVGTAFLGYSPLVRSTINRSMAYTLMGHLDEARADAEWGLVAARESGQLENVVIGLYATNLWAFHAGVEEGSLVRARESLQLA
jgi:hypothetical protein